MNCSTFVIDPRQRYSAAPFPGVLEHGEIPDLHLFHLPVEVLLPPGERPVWQVVGSGRSKLPPGETRPLLLHLPHLPDGVLLPPAKAIVWQVLWPGWNVLLPGETGFVLLHCDTVELPLPPREVFVWQVLGGGWCLFLLERSLFYRSWGLF